MIVIITAVSPNESAAGIFSGKRMTEGPRDEYERMRVVERDRVGMEFQGQLIVQATLSAALAQPLNNKYGSYVTYVIKGFIPPESLFRKMAFPFDHTSGDTYKNEFKRTYGMFGEDLVRAYGLGLSKGQLLKHGLL